MVKDKQLRQSDTKDDSRPNNDDELIPIQFSHNMDTLLAGVDG